jgi:hypothetical protein
MPKVDPEHITLVVKTVLAVMRRNGRLPTRLDEEDMNDLESEGTLTALMVVDRFDPERGSLRAYLDKPVARAILKAAWGIANGGITGDHGALQVWSFTDNTDESEDYESSDEMELPASDDVAAEIEAFDHVWHTRYLHD